MRWKPHVRFGGRAGETHSARAGQALRSDPYTKLRGPQTWTWYYLYVVLDVFSRYAVGWAVAARESAALAEELIRSCLLAEGVGRDELTIHADRGSSMTSKPVAHLLADLGVTKSHSRPHQCLLPLLGGPVQDAQVLPDVPGALLGPRARPVVH